MDCARRPKYRQCVPTGQIAAIIVVVAIAVAIRPIEVRLWRSGRITGRTLKLLLLGRFPVLVGLLGLLEGDR